MSQRRNSRASVSTQDASNSTKELKFCAETGKTYRPFIDPKRIETNDAKKSSTCDSRARVKNVPDEYLGVMTFAEHPSALIQNAPQLEEGQVLSGHDGSHLFAVDQQEIFTLDVSTIPHSGEIDPRNPSEMIHSVEAMPTNLPTRLYIPTAPTSQSGCENSPYSLQGSFYYSAPDECSTSTYHLLPDSAVTDAFNEHFNLSSRERTDIQMPGLELPVAGGQNWPGSTSLYSLDSNSSAGSPDSSFSLDSLETYASSSSGCMTAQNGYSFYGHTDPHCELRSPLDAYEDVSSPVDLSPHFLKGHGDFMLATLAETSSAGLSKESEETLQMLNVSGGFPFDVDLDVIGNGNAYITEDGRTNDLWCSHANQDSRLSSELYLT